MIVLDTHTLVWWVNGAADLSKKALKAIEVESQSEDGKILVSSICAWEISLLIQKGRLALSMNIDDWLDTIGELDAVEFVPVNNDVAVQSTRLPGEFHSDPADRIIVALARHYSVPLITADKRIRSYRHVKTIW